MQLRPTIIGISGSVTRPSRTTSLVRTILQTFDDTVSTHLFELVDEAPFLFSSLTSAKVEERISRSVEEASRQLGRLAPHRSSTVIPLKATA